MPIATEDMCAGAAMAPPPGASTTCVRAAPQHKGGLCRCVHNVLLSVCVSKQRETVTLLDWASQRNGTHARTAADERVSVCGVCVRG